MIFTSQTAGLSLSSDKKDSVTDSILHRRPSSLSAPSSITPAQFQVDQLITGFREQATDWKSLAAMVAGGMAYRMGRVGLMGMGSGNLIRVASIGAGLTAEVSAFELTYRRLTTLSSSFGSTIGGHPHGGAPTNGGESNLWRWGGQGGIRQGLLQSFITFGTLKGAGRLASGENPIVQHLMQDSAMVLGHNVSGILGITPKPTETLPEQFFRAEVTNLQIVAGMTLVHRMAPGIHGIERGLDLSLGGMRVGAGSSRPQTVGAKTAPLRIQSRPAFAVSGSESASSGLPETRGPLILRMDAPANGGGAWTRRKSLKKTDQEAYRIAEEELSLSALSDRADAFTLKILRSSTALNFKKVLAANAHLDTVLSLTRLARRGHLWAFGVLSEAARGSQHAVYALTGMAERNSLEALDALGRAAAAENSLSLIQILNRFAEGGSRRARNILKRMEPAPFQDDAAKKDPLIRGLLLLARNGNEEAYKVLVERAKTESLALDALYKLATRGRLDAQETLAVLDSQWIIRAFKKNGWGDYSLYQLSKFGNAAAQIALMESAQDKWGPFFKMAQLSKEGYSWATEWLVIQAETNPMAQRLLPILAQEGHRNAQEILQNKKTRSEETDDGQGSGNSQASLFGIDFGLGALFGQKRLGEGEISADFPWNFFSQGGENSWSENLPLIGLGIAVAAGIGIWAWRQHARWEVRYQSSPYTKLFIPLTPQEQESLQSFFGWRQVPAILTGRDWLKIEEKLFNDPLHRERNRLLRTDRGALSLFIGIQLRAEALLHKLSSPPAKEPEPSPLALSRNVEIQEPDLNLPVVTKVTSLADYREQRELKELYENLASTFASKEDLKNFLLESLESPDRFIRERHVFLYEFHIQSLLKRHRRRLPPRAGPPPKIVEQIEVGLKAIYARRTDPAQSVRFAAVEALSRLRNIIPENILSDPSPLRRKVP